MRSTLRVRRLCGRGGGVVYTSTWRYRQRNAVGVW